MSGIEAILAAVAGELSWGEPPPVFIGGATIGLYLDDFARAHLRTTKDVDCIVPAVVTTMQWFALERELQQRGWSPDRDGPICRYRSPSGHVVDLLARDPSVQGFSGTWFQAAVKNAEPRALAGGSSVLVPKVPWLLACKIEAYNDRGARDPMASADLEDIVALLDGCRDLAAQVEAADADVRALVSHWFTALAANASLLEIVVAQLPEGGADASRRRHFLRQVHRLAALTPS